MKRLVILLATVLYCTGIFAQTDSTEQTKKADTLRIGNIIIVKKGDKKSSGDSGVVVTKAPKKSRISTNWGIVDLGFANYYDKSDYAAANADGYLSPSRPGEPNLGEDDFKLRTGKSVNVNIWFFMQRLNLYKENISLKYGLGLELNNYRYKSSVSYKENGEIPYSPNGEFTNKAFIFRDSITFEKNKLAADFITIPLMINFSTNDWGRHNGFNIALGVSGGYLYNQRNKQVSESRGKWKNKGDYDLEKFKFSYIGEIGFGPVSFYASYSPHSMYDHSLDMRPYNFGIRLSHD